ncbi:unnamed protein product, partial [Ectocarpus sp. 12 AP-2014]
ACGRDRSPFVETASAQRETCRHSPEPSEDTRGQTPHNGARGVETKKCATRAGFDHRHHVTPPYTPTHCPQVRVSFVAIVPALCVKQKGEGHGERVVLLLL